MFPGLNCNDQIRQNECKNIILLLFFPFLPSFHEDTVLQVLSYVSAWSVLRWFGDRPDEEVPKKSNRITKVREDQF